MNLMTKCVVMIFAITATIGACKCKKDKPVINVVPAPSIAPSEYHQLRTGNYWIYAQYRVDSTGKAEMVGTGDSCYVEKDTTIGGNTYRKFVQNGQISGRYIQYLRDSSDLLINDKGDILFSANDFTNVFSSFWLISGMIGPKDSIAFIKRRMESRDSVITVPAGSFRTQTFATIYFMHPFYSSHGAERRYCTRYAAKVGIVSETVAWYTQSSDIWERRLVRYKVQ